MRSFDCRICGWLVVSCFSKNWREWASWLWFETYLKVSSSFLILLIFLLVDINVILVWIFKDIDFCCHFLSKKFFLELKQKKTILLLDCEKSLEINARLDSSSSFHHFLFFLVSHDTVFKKVINNEIKFFCIRTILWHWFTDIHKIRTL